MRVVPLQSAEPAGLQGRTYLCKRLDLESKVAVVRPADLKYYTKVRDFCDVHVTGGRAYYPAAVCTCPRFHCMTCCQLINALRHVHALV